MTTIHIAASREYDVVIEPGLLTRLGTMAAELGLGRRAAAFTQQAEQQVLRANVAVTERSGRFLCKRQCLTGTLGKTVLIEHK